VRRRALIIVAALALLVVGAGIVAYSWLGSDDARTRLERVLSEALHRTVTIEGLEVQPTRGIVELTGVTIANPEGWDGAPMLTAGRVELEVDLDDALDGRLDGAVEASGLDLRIAKRDGAINLQGMHRKDGATRAVDLHLDIELTDARVLLEDLDRGETMRLDGVRLDALLSNRAEGKDADVDLEVGAVSVRGVGLHHVALSVTGTDDAVVVRRLAARIGDAGKIHGAGRVQLDADTDWSLQLEAHGVAIDADLLPVVVAFYPPAAGVDAPPQGKLDAALELAGAGFAWETLRPVLRGTGSVTTRDVVLPRESLAVEVAALGGRIAEPWAVGTTTVDVTLADGWVVLGRVENEGTPVAVPVTGRVGLDGALDLEVDLMPLVRAFGGGAYATVARYTSSIPMRVQGTTSDPQFKPPTAAAVAKGLVGGLVGRALGDP
jgi:hypothetical protein